jgi:hypothetical protein
MTRAQIVKNNIKILTERKEQLLEQGVTPGFLNIHFLRGFGVIPACVCNWCGKSFYCGTSK